MGSVQGGGERQRRREVRENQHLVTFWERAAEERGAGVCSGNEFISRQCLGLGGLLQEKEGLVMSLYCFKQ